MTRPQTLLLTLLGRHVLHRDVAVFSGTFIAVLDRLDVSEDAARSTLTRMVRRGYLERHRRGRRTYFGLTSRTRRLLTEGEERIFHHTPPREPTTGEWTLLSFSIPEERRNDRHSLRVALAWRGFGSLRDGLWVAPGEVDVTEVVDELALRDHVEVFVGHTAPPTDARQMVGEAWDLDAIRAGYGTFLRRWKDDELAGARGDLARQIRLITEWRLLLIDDPQLPLAYLPDDWPAEEAYELFRIRHDEVSAGAETEFEGLLDAIGSDS